MTPEERLNAMTPQQRVNMVAMVDELSAELGATRDQNDALHDENARFLKANVELALELTDRIIGENAIVGEERFFQALNAALASAEALRALSKALLVLLKNARTFIIGTSDHGQALEDIDEGLASLGVVL